MDGHVFDQDYIVREATDDLLTKVETREKLILNARDLAEKRKEESHASVIKNFENLMSDFLHFYQPLIEKINRHEGTLRTSVSELKTRLSSTRSMLQVTKNIEGSGAKTDEFEREITHLEKSIQTKDTTIDRIKKLLDKTKPYISGSGSESSSFSPDTSDSERSTRTHRKRGE